MLLIIQEAPTHREPHSETRRLRRFAPHHTTPHHTTAPPHHTTPHHTTPHPASAEGSPGVGVVHETGKAFKRVCLWPHVRKWRLPDVLHKLCATAHAHVLSPEILRRRAAALEQKAAAAGRREFSRRAAVAHRGENHFQQGKARAERAERAEGVELTQGRCARRDVALLSPRSPAAQRWPGYAARRPPAVPSDCRSASTGSPTGCWRSSAPPRGRP